MPATKTLVDLWSYIFRIDPNTPCNTHDLLECPCEGPSISDDTLSREDGDDGMETEQGFVKACNIKPEFLDKMDRAYLQKKKAGLAALGEWKHINCLKPSTRDDIQDDALRKLIDFHDSSTTNETSLPKSRIDKLLDSIDLQNITALNKCLNMREVPGGTISYIFQKSSIATINTEREGEEALA
ncbi:hypothetical protein C0995_016004 [Termitomyces sp. Mi166|nr:hypothetical protein C0995_016004 [Termitomyces sp. Mi166\